MLIVEYHEYVAGWGTLTLLNTAIAQLHGKSTWLWFIISLLLGPIATLILLLTYK